MRAPRPAQNNRQENDQSNLVKAASRTQQHPKGPVHEPELDFRVRAARNSNTEREPELDVRVRAARNSNAEREPGLDFRVRAARSNNPEHEPELCFRVLSCLIWHSQSCSKCMQLNK